MTARALVAILLAATSGLVALARSPVSFSPLVQGGEQFLDGIGETALVARYVLDATAEDSSRHQFHATLRGSGTFVDDEQFRRALLLTGDGSHLQLPGAALTGEDTLSVTAWVYLPTGASGPVFDFGQNASTKFAAIASPAGLRCSILGHGSVRGETTAPPFLENRWVHLVVVLDPAARLLTTYVDGAKAGQATNVTVNATDVVNQAVRDSNRLFIGRAQDDRAPAIHARFRDVR